MGEVYAAFDPQRDREVALKLMQEVPGGAESRCTCRAPACSGRRRRFARLSHPNVVVVRDTGEIGERVFLAMEFVDGCPVTNWLTEAPRTWSEILGYSRQPAGASRPRTRLALSIATSCRRTSHFRSRHRPRHREMRL
jgi:serine/threonine protein kinase